MTLQAGLPRFGTALADKQQTPLAADHAMIDHGGEDVPGFQMRAYRSLFMCGHQPRSSRNGNEHCSNSPIQNRWALETKESAKKNTRTWAPAAEWVQVRSG
jgi:hypothetical protein